MCGGGGGVETLGIPQKFSEIPYFVVNDHHVPIKHLDLFLYLTELLCYLARTFPTLPHQPLVTTCELL